MLYSSCDLFFLHFTHFIKSLNQQRTFSSFLLSHYPQKTGSTYAEKAQLLPHSLQNNLLEKKHRSVSTAETSNRPFQLLLISGYLTIAVFLSPSLLSVSVEHKEGRVCCDLESWRLSHSLATPRLPSETDVSLPDAAATMLSAALEFAARQLHVSACTSACTVACRPFEDTFGTNQQLIWYQFEDWLRIFGGGGNHKFAIRVD